jgi:flagellar motility protein MotE (MotC chaperone)
VRIWKEAERKDESFKEAQKRRVLSQYSGMKDTDRVATILKKIYDEENFSKFYRAMT